MIVSVYNDSAIIGVLLLLCIVLADVEAASLKSLNLHKHKHQSAPSYRKNGSNQGRSRTNARDATILSDWQMIWSDEFSVWDTTKWNFQIGDGCDLNLCGWGNQELQYYTPNNVNVDQSGRLLIQAREETGTSQQAVQQQCWDACGAKCSASGLANGSPELHNCVLQCGNGRCPNIRFTSGRINTMNKFSISPSSMNYSTIRVEANIELTPGQSLWPAFWLLPQDSKYGIWPNSGEIDIMESQSTMSGVNGTLHFVGPDGQHHFLLQSYPITPGPHVYRIDWNVDSIKWYVDGNMYGSVQNAQWRSSVQQQPGSSSASPFGDGDNFYILLNMAVGGMYTGNPSPDAVSSALAAGPSDKIMAVDYVRVYGRN